MNARAVLIAQMAKARGLDPRAVLAIASVEGGFHGSVGDNGTSFGPFQLHEGGALPRGKGNAWANSKQGIAYALDSMVKDGIAGLTGQQAVAAISSKFERPANVPAEISKAMSRYGGQFGGGSAPLQSAGGGGLTAPTVGGVSGGGGNPAAQMVAAQMLQQAQALAQPAQPGQPSPLSPGAAGALSNPSSLLAMSMQAQAAKPGPVMMSPQGKLSVSGANPNASEDMRAIRLAEKYIGTPYVWGGDKPGGFDCSGLLQYVWAHNGVNIPRTSQEQFHYGKPVSPHNLQPGDAVFFEPGPSGPGHVAMYIGNGKVIQAPHTGTDVQISPLNAMGPIVGARSFTG